MSLPESSLFAGVAGVELPVDQFDFGQGIIFRKTFCHVFAPFVAAFARAPRGKPHPAPWKPVDGGLGFDILAELHVPADFRPPEWFDRLNSVWWFAALVRLIGNPHAVVPVIASHPFAEMATMEGEPNIRTMEVYRRRLKLENPTCQLSINSLGWIKDNWRSGMDLMYEYDDLLSINRQVIVPIRSASSLSGVR